MTSPPDPGDRAGAALDALLDAVVAAFAGWTLWYEFALAARLDLWGPSLVWLVVTAVAVPAYVVRAALRPGLPAVPEDATPRWGRGPRLAWFAAAGLLAATLVLHLGLHLGGLLPVVVAMVLVLAASVVASSGPATPPGPDAEGVPAVGLPSHLVAVTASAGLAVLASALVKGDADDVFYVNRSTWIAEHGVAALRDTMFGAERFPSTYGGGLPLSSVEGLVGGLAHDLHAQVGTVTYLAAVPLLAFLAGLATWRLVRAWAPRRPLLVFLVAEAFLLLSGASVQGGYFITRIWQGKVIASCVLVPLIWAAVARVHRHAGRGDLAMLGALGVAFVGLSSTAPIQVPMIAGPVLLAAALLRRRSLALGAVALLAAPITSGLVQLLDRGSGQVAPEGAGVAYAWRLAFGTEPAMVALALVAIVLGSLLARGGRALPVVCAGLAALATLLPGVFGLFDALTGAGPVAWRLLIELPLGVLVGLLVAAPAYGARRLPRPVVPATVLVVLAVVMTSQGLGVWDRGAGAHAAWPPAWKVDATALGEVRALVRDPVLTAEPGPWLLPEHDMGVLAQVTTRRFAVVPREFYLDGLRGPGAYVAARRTLYAVEARRPLPTVTAARRALDLLGVAVACVKPADTVRARLLAAATGTPSREVAGLACHLLPVRRTDGSELRVEQARVDVVDEPTDQHAVGDQRV
ncbi:DUF6077 domain-containing protein [Nocardioides sp. LS1]|uniref:DUF6077 domain-containing protein n=1 Tax=Nocardioides sp. LS1 TaxID=1027620 RepID=UPI000F61A394|nr:DUF6077 domain-containing protein [Nocardioides sp. LS1]GCD89428.1 hypothetical protein NLS1_14340 [Nocardioides sp. LS1]